MLLSSVLVHNLTPPVGEEIELRLGFQPAEAGPNRGPYQPSFSLDSQEN